MQKLVGYKLSVLNNKPVNNDEIALHIEFVTGISQPLLANSIQKSLNATSLGEKCKVSNLNIVLGDDDLLKQLNKDFRGYDEPTDVLAFDLSDDPSAVEGDIYISLDRAEFQAAQFGEKTSKETVRLAVHGFLHLCGWDHDDEVSLKNMVECGEKYIVDLQEEG